MMPDSKSLTTKEVARLCRVSDATVKRWAEAGLLRSEKTSGGHRRFCAEEIARFQLRQRLGLKYCHGDESVVTAKLRRDNKIDSGSSFFHALVVGCEQEAANILICAYLNGTPLTEIFDDFICPALIQVGELWFRGELSVAQEHLATRAALNAVHKLRGVIPVSGMNGKLAMCCAIEGDFHELPTHLAQIIFENEGWEVMNFGANTPLYSLMEEACKHKPATICIAATVVSDIERLSRDFKSLGEQTAKHKIPIILGGRAFTDEQIRRRFPADFYPESFTELARFARG